MTNNKWPTDDDCVSCGASGMVFYRQRSIPHGSGIGEVHIGRLSCPVCGAESMSYCYDYQVPRFGESPRESNRMDGGNLNQEEKD